jgi:hypothetical protein
MIKPDRARREKGMLVRLLQAIPLISGILACRWWSRYRGISWQLLNKIAAITELCSPNCRSSKGVMGSLAEFPSTLAAFEPMRKHMLEKSHLIEVLL